MGKTKARGGKTKKGAYRRILLAGILSIGLVLLLLEHSKNMGTEDRLPEDRQLEIAVFEGGMGSRQWENIAAAFQKEYPDLEIKLAANVKIGEILMPGIIAGDAPDFIVMMDENTSGLMEKMKANHLLLDLTDVFKGDCYGGDGNLEDLILPGYLDSRKCMPYDDGKIYFAPLDSGYRGLVYNKRLFLEKGWKLPKTWDEFFELGDEAREEGRYLFTYPGIYPKYLANLLIPAIANYAGEEAVTRIFNYEKGSFLDQKVIEVLKKFEKLSRSDYLLPYTLSLNHIKAQEKMMMGEALFIPTGPWVEQEMEGSGREEPFQFAMTAAPVFQQEDAQYTIANYGQACIPAKAKNPEIAKEFLRFLYTKEAVEIYARDSNSVLAVKQGSEWARPFLTEDLYEMRMDMETMLPLLDDFANQSPLTETRVKEMLYAEGMTKLFSHQITVTELAQNMERLFAQIREERNLTAGR